MEKLIPSWLLENSKEDRDFFSKGAVSPRQLTALVTLMMGCTPENPDDRKEGEDEEEEEEEYDQSQLTCKTGERPPYLYPNPFDIEKMNKRKPGRPKKQV